MEYVLINKHELTNINQGSFVADPIYEDSDLYLLSVDDTNRNELSRYIKFNSNEISGIRNGGLKVKNKVSQSSKILPFNSNKLEDGSSLYTRIHGVGQVVANGATVELSFSVPYARAKWSGLELVCAKDCVFNVGIKDDEDGTFSETPNSVINQFGFDVAIGSEQLSYKSNYDANVYGDMVLFVSVTNNSGASKNVCVNYILHEVVNE